MADIVDSATRSRMMSGIRGKNTRPEILVRSGLHKRGFRFRVHDKRLPGKPDLVLRKYNAVVFVHGCFWHRHECRFFKWPRSRQAFWRAKLNRNHDKDREAISAIRDAGMRVCVVWECAIRGAQSDIPAVLDSISDWLKSDDTFLEVSE
jgi:DNA mismatch endonuclease (patch repair protein)